MFTGVLILVFIMALLFLYVTMPKEGIYQKKISKQKENYDTAWWRVNLTGRFKYASIGVFYNYSLTQLF